MMLYGTYCVRTVWSTRCYMGHIVVRTVMLYGTYCGAYCDVIWDILWYIL